MSRNLFSWDNFTRGGTSQRFKQYFESETGKQLLLRFVLPAAALAMLIAATHLYNIWTGLTLFNHIRRTLATIALGALLFGPAVLWRARVQAVYLGSVSLFVGFLLLANAVYTGYAGGFMSVSTLSYFWQASDTTGAIAQLLQPKLLVFMLPGVLLLAAAWLLPRWGGLWHWKPLRGWAVAALFGGMMVISGLGYGFVAHRELQEHGDLTRITSHPFDARELVRKVGITNYNVLDLINYLRRKRGLDAAELTFVQKHRAEQITPSGPNEATGWAAGKNIIFLQLESFEQFVVGRQVNGQEITPNFNKLAAASRQYTNFNYTIGPGTSSDAEFSTFNSLLPLANEAVVFDYPTDGYRSYVNELRKQDYHTHAYHADSRNYWNRANTFPVFGFDDYIAEESYKKGKVLGFGLNDRDFLAQTSDMIAKLKPPFYAHAITLSSHTPFKLPADEQTLDLSGVALTPLQKDYLQSVHYTDRAIGEFMDRLQKSGVMDNSILLTMGDHEGFIFGPEDRDFAKFLGYDNGFDDLSNLSARSIPFMIYAPGTSIHGIDPRPASQIDIYPTLLNLLGMKKPDTILGVDLYGDQQPTTIHRARGAGASIESVRRGNLLYITNSLSGKPACYQSDVLTSTATCNDIRDFAINRAIMSDDVITGNRIDLLSGSTAVTRQ